MVKRILLVSGIVGILGTFLHLPIAALTHAAGEEVMQSLGPEVNLDVLKQQLQQAQADWASARDLELVQEDRTKLQQEQESVNLEIPQVESRMRAVRDILESSTQPTLLVNGQEYPREEVASDAQVLLAHHASLIQRQKELPAEIHQMDQNLAQLRQKRSEAWISLQNTETEINRLESERNTAEALARTSSVSFGDNSDLAGSLERFRSQVSQIKAVADASRAAVADTSINFSGPQAVTDSLDAALGHHPSAASTPANGGDPMSMTFGN